MADPKFCIDWYAGASAQVEIFSPRNANKGRYQFKYTPAFRSTIRPPIEERTLGAGELDPITEELNGMAKAMRARAQGGAAAAAAIPPVPPADALEDLVMLGGQLLDLVVPQYVQGDLRSSEVSLEIGMDTELLEYPWELMHDGEEFLCLKHSVGRFVNGTRVAMAAQQPATRVGLGLDTISVLVISVPRPLPRGDLHYEYLPEAEAEAEAIVTALNGVDGVKVETLEGKDATYNEVFKALKRKYQIVHFCGHAHFDDENPQASALVLQNRDMTTGPIANYFGPNAPILCFVNACETTRMGNWKQNYDIFGLGRAFLETGAYLIGSRWKIDDKAAAGFAKTFYTALLKESKSLGNALREARITSKKAALDEFAWASYVLYGDPRVCFRRLLTL